MFLTARESLLLRAAEVGADVREAREALARLAERRAELAKRLGL